MADLVLELQNVARALTERGVEFAVCDGLAVAIHGHVRATEDIDLLVPGASRERALEALKSAGFDLLAQPMNFGAGTPAERHVQRVNKLVAGELVTVELIFVEPAFAEVWAARQHFERGGTRLCVVSANGLVAMKRLAGRKQDLADIEALERGTDG